MAVAEIVLVTPDENPEALEDERKRFEEIYGHPPDADASQIVAWVRDRYDEQTPAMQERFYRWVYQIKFATGDQWLITTDGRTYFEPPAPDGQVRVTRNLTWRALEYRISKLTENRPIPKVLPHSNEISDADKAEAAQQLLIHLDRVLDLGSRYDEALWYDALCGCAFFFVGWETETGEFVRAKKARLVIDPITGTPQVEEYFVNAEGEEVGSPDEAFQYRTGDPDVRVLPPWAVRVSNPEETDPRKQRYWMVAEVVEVSEIKRRYGHVADNIKGGDEYDQYVYYEDLISGWAEDGFRKRPKERPFVPRALVIQYFETPSLEYPKGRHIIICEDTLLHYGPLPYGNDEIGYCVPIVRLNTIHRPKDFYGKAHIEDIIPVQKTINQLESHALEYIRLFSRGGLAAEYGTTIEESWSDQYGSILYYSGERPQPLSWPGMPADVWQALSRAYENFDRIAGWADVARGDVPPGVKAARAILELKRSNDTPLGKALQRFDRAVELVSTKLIERAKWGYAEPHWIQIIGADSPHLVRAITSDDLPSRFTVKIETDSMLRLSYPAKLELLFELADRQWVSPESAMRLLNFADWEHQSGQWNRDYARARNKIERLLAGEPVGVEWWEDDKVHMLALEERMKDPRFDSLEPWQKMALTMLWTEHYKNWMMKQQGMLPPQLQALMQPQVPGMAVGAPALPAPAPAPAPQPAGGSSSSRRAAPDFSGGEALYNPVDVSPAEATAGY